MKDVLFLNNMVTPKIITFVYWLMLAGVLISGLAAIFSGEFMGIFVIIFGAVGARIWCELLIVLFKMNEALQEMRSKQ